MDIAVNVPEGVSGSWMVERFVVTQSEADFHNMREQINRSRGLRLIKPGEYVRLARDGYTIMSNTPAEILDHKEFIRRARGRVLVNGLGLGVALKAILEKSDVEHVTIVEASEDVISLVGAAFSQDSRVEIVHADAFDYQPPKGLRYNVVWHDIWDDITADNLDGMKKLHRKYGKRCDWQGSWCRDLCEEYARRW